MNKRRIRKNVNAVFGVLGLGVLVASQVAASGQARHVEVTDEFPNPGFADGTYTVDNMNSPIASITATVDGGRIVDINANYNDHNRKSHAINTTTVQELSNRVLREQSADNLDMVTGATATSQAFIGSLQDIINQARS